MDPDAPNPAPSLPLLSYASAPAAIQYVPVATYPTEFEANLALLKLESEGIDCHPLEQALAQDQLGINTSRIVSVRPEHVEQAKAILAEIAARRTERKILQPHPVTSRSRRWTLARTALALGIGAIALLKFPDCDARGRVGCAFIFAITAAFWRWGE